jgi:hypothetical protein
MAPSKGRGLVLNVHLVVKTGILSLEERRHSEVSNNALGQA